MGRKEDLVREEVREGERKGVTEREWRKKKSYYKRK